MLEQNLKILKGGSKSSTIMKPSPVLQKKFKKCPQKQTIVRRCVEYKYPKLGYFNLKTPFLVYLFFSHYQKSYHYWEITLYHLCLLMATQGYGTSVA